MANGQGSIDEVIGQQALKHVVDFEAAMKKLADQMTDTLSIANQLNSATGLKSVQQGVQGITTAITKTKEYTLTIAAQAVEQSRVRSEMKLTAKQMSDNAGAYSNLDATQQKAAKSARDAGIQFGINSTQFKEAAKSSNEYLSRLKAVDEALGNSRRNVGNYQGAVFSLSQVIRELPSFTYSAQQGFLAIGNNLPILIDQFKLLREQVGSTGKAIGIFARSIFSFVNVFTILSGLFTIFYKDIMQFVRGTDSAAESLKKVAEGTADAKNEIARLKETLREAQKGVIDKTTFLKAYNEVLGSTLGTTNDFNVAETNTINKADVYLAMLEAKIRMNEALAVSQQAVTRSLDIGRTGSSQWTMLKAQTSFGVNQFKQFGLAAGVAGLFGQSEAAYEYYYKTARDEAKIAQDAAKKAILDYNNLVDVVDPKTGGKTTKDKKEANRITELKQVYENELNELKIYHASNQETEIEFQAKVLQLNAEYATKKIDAVKNLSKDERDTALEWKAKILEDTRQINDDIAQESLELFRKLEEDGAKSYETDKKQLDEKKKSWDKAYEHFISLVDKLDAEEDKKRNAKIGRETKQREEALKRTEIYWDNYVSAGQSAMDIIGSVADGVFAREMQMFDVKERRLKDFYDNEKRFIDQSGFSSLQRQKMQQKLDAETEAKRKQIDRDRITALRKQAAYEKAFNIAQIITETALAVIRALSDKAAIYPVRVAYAISAGAAGAAQLARAIATPLPQYARGRKGGRKEWAVVGEAGQEAIVHNGRVELTPNQATVTLLPEGADVIPNHELIKNAAYVKLSKQGVVTTDKLQAALLNAFDREHEDNIQLQKILLGKNFSMTNKDLSGYEAYRKTKVQ